ncbi:MAG: XRE family transcriptional regulator [Comamonadaceae bacterium]|nr:MAG: XRE family transcriptional regulator [Comamonadaceae bacterium]
MPEWDRGDRLKKALREAKMSSSDMAEELGITRETVGRYMSGSAKVPLAIVKLWAITTGIDYEWLQSGSESSTREVVKRVRR